MINSKSKLIKDYALSIGADVCGVASIDRFGRAPQGFSPKDVFVKCKSVVVVGVSLPKGLLDVQPEFVYNHFNYISCPTVDNISFQISKMLESNFGGITVPVPCDNPYEYWNEEEKEGRGLISMKHAAVCAGIGTMGKNTLLINPSFGNRLTIGAVLTDVEIEADDLLKDQCLPNCHLCIDNCPVGAIGNGSVCQQKCRPNTYGTSSRGFDTVMCNKCRIVCPLRYGVQNK